MEELADAIEDAQYVNAISTLDDGPKPVLPWEKPTDEQLEEWKREVIKRQTKINEKIKKRLEQERSSQTERKQQESSEMDLSAALKVDAAGSGGTGVICEAFTLEWVCQQPIGYFLFSQYIKQTMKDYIRINFCEEALRFKKVRGRRMRLEKALMIAKAYLVKPIPVIEENPKSATDDSNSKGEEGTTVSARSVLFANNVPRPTEIVEYDLYRRESSCSHLEPQEIKAMITINMDYPVCEESFVGVKGPVRQEILAKILEVEKLFPDTAQGVVTKVATEVATQGSTVDISNEVPANLRNSKELRKNRAARLRNTVDMMDSDVLEDKNEDMYRLDRELNETAPTAVQLAMSRSKSAMMPSSQPLPLTSSGTTKMLNNLSNKVRQKKSHHIYFLLPEDMFDKAEMIVVESLRADYWEGFRQSPQYQRLIQFLWYQDRRVVPDDFLTMRVLGRGGFGLVYGTLQQPLTLV